MNLISVYNNQRKVVLTDSLKELMETAVNAVLRHEHVVKDCEVTISIVSDKKIKTLNNKYRNVNKSTDVLSFPLSDKNEPDFAQEETILLGDIVISAETAERQAYEYGHSFEREMAFLCIHAALHLLGYDHEISFEDEQIMFEKQDEIIKSVI